MDFFRTPRVLNDPAAYAGWQQSEHAGRRDTPPGSPRGSSSFSMHSLHEALPGLRSRSPSPEPSGHWYGPGAAEMHQREQEWAHLSARTLRHHPADAQAGQAIHDLSLVYAGSETFRRTMATVDAEGPVNVRVDPEVSTAYFRPHGREVVLGQAYTGSRPYAMGVLAFELTNASLSEAYSAHEREAAMRRMSPHEFAEGAERIEYNSVRDTHRYYEESRGVLYEAGLDVPQAWQSSVTEEGEVVPWTGSEDESVHNAMSTGHFGQYAQSYARRPY